MAVTLGLVPMSGKNTLAPVSAAVSLHDDDGLIPDEGLAIAP